MQDKNGLELGTAQRGTPGKTLLVKNTTAADMATIRDTFGYKTDPIDGSTLIFSDVDSAINAVGATSRTNLSDKILISAGYTETVATASDITSDIAGLSIIGLGEGADRPTFTFSATASTWVMSGASSVLKNVIFKPSVDSVVSPLVVSGADCTVDLEVQDASSTVECVRAVLTTAAASRLKLKLKYQGFTAGNACVNAVRLVGGTGAELDIDFYGIASTAVVEFHTTPVVDCIVKGYMYNSGTTNYSKDVVDTVTGSTWYAEIQDGAAGATVSGGSGNALAAGDLSVISTAVVTTIPGLLAVPNADVTTNTNERDVIGNKTDAVLTDATEGSGATTKSLMCLLKAVLNRIGADSNNNTVATTNVVANGDGSVLERLENIQQLVGGTDGATNILGANNNNNGFDSSTAVANDDGSILERLEGILQKVNGTDSATNVLGANNNNNTFDSSTVVANDDGSVLERLESVLQNVSGVDRATNVLGSNNNNNAFDSTQAVANRDGSLIERTEAIMAGLIDDTTSNIIGSNNNNNLATSENVVPNHDGTIIERLEALAYGVLNGGMSVTNPSYLKVSADMSSATWNTQATHEILTCTGLVRVIVLPVVTATLTDAADGASMQLGIEGATNAIIASTQCAGGGGNTLSTNELWLDATPADVIATKTQLDALTVVVPAGLDIGYEITGAALTGGSMDFHCWWAAMDATGAVAAGAGGAL